MLTPQPQFPSTIFCQIYIYFHTPYFEKCNQTKPRLPSIQTKTESQDNAILKTNKEKRFGTPNLRLAFLGFLPIRKHLQQNTSCFGPEPAQI